jgi:hypothetical protein
VEPLSRALALSVEQVPIAVSTMYVDECPTKSPISSSEQPAACISET